MIKENEKRIGGEGLGLTIIVLLFSLLVPPFALAKSGKKVLILNSDASVSKYSVAQAAFSSKLEKDSTEIDIGYKWTDFKKVEESIREKDHEIIYCIGSKALQLAQRVAKDKKIIFSLAINWKRFDLEKNTSGIANELNSSMELTMFRYLFPRIRKIGVLYSEAYSKEWVKASVERGKNVGIELVPEKLTDADQLTGKLKSLIERVDALWLIADPVVLSGRGAVKEIFKRSNKAKKPTFAYGEVFTKYGAVLAISPDIPTIGRQAADLARELISNGENRGKVVEPAGSQIVLNLKKVKEFGLDLNMDALDSVNKIIK